MKSYQNPIGKDRLPTIIFQWFPLAVKLRGGNLNLKMEGGSVEQQIPTLEIKETHMKSGFIFSGSDSKNQTVQEMLKKSFVQVTKKLGCTTLSQFVDTQVL